MNLIQVSKHKKLMENNGELSNSLLDGPSVGRFLAIYRMLPLFLK